MVPLGKENCKMPQNTLVEEYETRMCVFMNALWGKGTVRKETLQEVIL